MKREKLLRIAELMEEMAGLFRELAEVGNIGAQQDQGGWEAGRGGVVSPQVVHEEEAPGDEEDLGLFSSEENDSEGNHPLFLVQDMEDGGDSVEEAQAEERVKELLRKRGFTLKRTKDKSLNPAIEHLARFVGERYAHLRPLMQKIRRMQGTQKQIHLDLQEQSPQVISDVMQFVNLAKQAGLIPGFFYQKRPPARKVICNPPVAPLAINFFTGEWLEVYALLTLRQLEKDLGVKLGLLWGAAVTLPNGEDFELDFVFSHGEDLYWVEVKTADDFSEMLHKYANVVGMLTESQERSILLWGEYEKNNPILSLRSSLANMTLVDIPSFKETVRESLLKGKQGSPA